MLIFFPSPAHAQPKWVSSICPTFIRDGTPKGFNKISIGVPSSRWGISSTGTILEIQPLLPWRPAILSPACNFLFAATKTLTVFMTPGGKSSPNCNFSTFIWNLFSKFFSSSSKFLFKFWITSCFFLSFKTIFLRSLYKKLSISFNAIFWFFFKSFIPFDTILSTRFFLRICVKDSSKIVLSSSLSLAKISISDLSIAKDLSSFSTPLLLKTLTSTTVPASPGGTLKEVSLTSVDFSPKIDLNSFSSGEIVEWAFGVIFPTKISLAFTSAPI